MAPDDRQPSPGPRAERRVAWLAGAILIVAAAALYLATLDDGLRPGELLGGDLITHQYAQVLARPSNAPGYPLYTMGGWLWFRVGRLLLGPAANPIPILSSYSTLWGLIALILLYGLILDVTRRNWPVAVLVTAFYAVTFFFWYYSVTTEEYTSAVAWTLGVVWLTFRWQRTRRDICLLAIAFLTGVGLAHILTVLVIMPVILALVLCEEPGLLRRPRLIASVIGLALLPLASYAFVYVRGAQHPEWRGAGTWTSTWQWFWSFVSTKQGRDELTWSWTPFLTSEFPRLIWQEMTWPGLVGGLAGLAGLGRRRGGALYAIVAAYVILCWIDRQGNWFQVIMPIYALLALGLAVAADRLWRAARPGAAARVAVALGLAVLVAYRGLTSCPTANARGRSDDTGLAPGWAILADDPPPHTLVLGTLPEMAALNYLTEIWGLRPDLVTVTSVQARKIVAGGSPVAVTEAALPLVPVEVVADGHYSALGRTLIAVRSAPVRGAAIGPDFQPWTHDFGPALRLAGGRVLRSGAAGEYVVTLAWQVRAVPTEDWSVSVRLTQAGNVIAQADAVRPVAGAYPTTRWSAGEVVLDSYALAPRAGTLPDGVTVILYHKTENGSYVDLDTAHFPYPAGPSANAPGATGGP